jgi:protein-S-isoprenylcysteine O-methyltransferase Ste14
MRDSEVVLSENPFLKGSRGEWYLVVQAGLFALLVFGPRTWKGLPAWSAPLTRIGVVGGGVLFAAGILLAAAGAISLGRNLTPLPQPKTDAALIVTGAYRLVRHPIYSGIALMALGWGLWLPGWLTIGYAILLFVFFDVKSRREERLLEAKFPEYAEYRKRVRKLVPFVY